MIWLPILAAVFHAAGTIYQKHFLRKSRIGFEDFLGNYTLAVALISLLAAPLGWSVDVAGALHPNALLLLFALAILAAAALWLYHHALRHEELTKFDLIVVIEPLLIIGMAGVFLPNERDPRIWVAVGICLALLAMAHIRRARFQFNRDEYLLLAGTICVAIGSVIIRKLLEFYSPFALQAIVASLVATIYAGFYGIRWYRTVGSLTKGILVSAGLHVLMMLAHESSYLTFGVTVTTLVELLYPVLLYLAARHSFGEWQSGRMTIAGTMILGVVMYSILFLLPRS